MIYADPPWRYEHCETDSRQIENQYPTMSLDEICAINIPATDDAILFMWTTAPKLAEGLKVVEAWVSITAPAQYGTSKILEWGIIFAFSMKFFDRYKRQLADTWSQLTDQDQLYQLKIRPQRQASRSGRNDRNHVPGTAKD